MRNFLKTKFNRIKNTFEKPSKKTFGKIGLFLIFGSMMLNLNFSAERIVEVKEYKEKKISIGLVNTVEAWTFKEAAEGAFGNVLSVALPGGSILKGTYETLKGVGISPKDGLLWVFNWMLYSVLLAISKLLEISGVLLDFSLRTDYLSEMVRSEEVYRLWAAVRDVLNLFFMLLLLFSAFATIFQVEKYHLRKIIIMLVVMALLVNFSFPIALFVIDFSNSAMHFLLEAAFGDNKNISKSAGLNSVTDFGNVLSAYYGKGGTVSFSDGGTTAQLITSIVLLFIYFITIAALAINLLIRMVSFVVLVILSPFGFAFAFFPGTTGLSNEWWDKLLKYAFIGPVMAFFLLIVRTLFSNGALSGSQNIVSGENIGVSIPIHIVAIIFLWLGLSFSNKIGGIASGTAMGIAQSTGGKIKAYGQKAAWGTVGMAGRGVDAATGHRISGGVGGLKATWDSWGEDYKSKSNTRKTQAADFFGVAGANEKLVQENRKKWKEAGGLDDKEAARIEKSGTKAEKMALALERAETKGFDKDPTKAFVQYQAGLAAIGDNKVYKDIFESNSKKKHIDLVVRQEIETKNAASIKAGTGPLNSAQIITHAEEIFSKLSPTQWKDQNMERLVDSTAAHSADIIDAAKAVINGRPTGPGGTMLGGYSQKAKENLANDMEKKKYAHGQSAGLWS